MTGVWLRAVFTLLVVAVAATAAATVFRKHTEWTPDGFVYARMMLQDRGLASTAAEQADETFFAKTPLAANSNTRALIGPNKPKFFELQFNLFSNRPLYPWVAAALYDRFGFYALIVVSLLAYVGASAALYWLLDAFGNPWIAVIVTMVALFVPWMFLIAAAPITDMLALAFLNVVLASVVRYLRSGASWAIVVFLLSSTLLAFTRPAIYLPLGTGIGALIAAHVLHRSVAERRACAILGAALAIAAAYAAYMSYSHAPGLRGQIAYLYERHMESGSHRDLPFRTWYVLLVGRTLLDEMRSLATSPIAFPALIVAAAGFWARRQDVAVGALAGCALTLPLAIVANPSPGGLARTVDVPLIPIVAAGLVCALSSFSGRSSTSQNDARRPFDQQGARNEEQLRQQESQYRGK